MDGRFLLKAFLAELEREQERERLKPFFSFPRSGVGMQSGVKVSISTDDRGNQSGNRRGVIVC
ncbi:hypothetical protein D5085_03980 [Ectothiorhodospiraceae bacterium BW-2]|nr:hypothetical protein D5085_03980 [Ectothiorhodospiraceae bacterium BW-2]